MFYQATTITRKWSPVGFQPNVISVPGRKKIGFFGMVNLNNGQLITNDSGEFNQESFIEFINIALTAIKDQKIYIILDNARWHRSKRVFEFIKNNNKVNKNKRIVFLFLPPYSPELNPIERVWKLTRRLLTHNRYFKTINHMITELLFQFLWWSKPNDILHNLCANI